MAVSLFLVDYDILNSLLHNLEARSEWRVFDADLPESTNNS